MPRRFEVGLVAIAVWLFAFLDTQPCRAEEGKSPVQIETVTAGSSFSSMRKKALAEIPLDLLAAEQRPKLDEIIKNVSLFRRMPTLRFHSEPDVYQFFLAHPEAAVSIWRVMEISSFELKPTGPQTYAADSNDGSTGDIEVLHSAAGRQLIVCAGSFKSPLLPRPIKANALLHLQPTFQKGADGQTVVTHTLDMFVSFPSQPVDITAKLISPLSHAMADRNFREVTQWVAMMNVAMNQQPEWVEQVAGQMQGVSEARRGQLLKLALQSSINARRRSLQNGTTTKEVSLEEVNSTLKRVAAEPTSELDKGAVPASGEKPATTKVEPASAKR